jgi:hypothetical protein
MIGVDPPASESAPDSIPIPFPIPFPNETRAFRERETETFIATPIPRPRLSFPKNGYHVHHCCIVNVVSV